MHQQACGIFVDHSRLFSNNNKELKSQTLFSCLQMKRSNVKSRIKKDELNPLFHFKDIEEDDKVLTKAVMKLALKSGKLVLSNKHLKAGELRHEQD